MRNLDRLHDYWTAGFFPASDVEGARRPRFVDDDADAPLAWESEMRLCAVGYLLAADLGAEAARAIAADFQYAAVGDIRSEVLDDWAATSGLYLDELAAIQPTYGFRPRPQPARLDPATVRSLLQTREAQVNACVHDRLGPHQAHPTRIDARVTVAMDGRVTAVALSTGLDPVDDFAVQACVADVISAMRFPRFRGEAVTAAHAFSVIGPTTRGRLNPAYLPVGLPARRVRRARLRRHAHRRRARADGGRGHRPRRAEPASSPTSRCSRRAASATCRSSTACAAPCSAWSCRASAAPRSGHSHAFHLGG